MTTSKLKTIAGTLGLVGSVAVGVAEAAPTGADAGRAAQEPKERAPAQNPDATPSIENPNVKKQPGDSPLLHARQAEVDAWTDRLVVSDPEFLSAAAGSWLDRRTATFYFATTSATLKSRLEAQGLPNYIVLQLVEHSFAELEALSDLDP